MINLRFKEKTKEWELITDEPLNKCAKCKKIINQGFFCKETKGIYCTNCNKKVLKLRIHQTDPNEVDKNLPINKYHFHEYITNIGIIKLKEKK
jgi:DNA-directed RNA polymerase subunit RPC12/RpoP